MKLTPGRQEELRLCRRETKTDGVTLGNRVIRGLEKAVKQVLTRERCESCGYAKNHAKQRKQLGQSPEEEAGHCIVLSSGFLQVLGHGSTVSTGPVQNATYANCTYFCITGIIFITSSYHVYYYLIIFILINFPFHLNTCIFN